MVAVGGTHSCALTLAGAAYCWGENASGQLGVGRSDTVAHRVPLKVTGGVIFRGLVAGLGHTCGLTTTGEVYCWGNNRSGQLGSVFLGQFASPTRVEGIPAMTALAAGDYHTCGLTNDGIAYCWGDNAVGQLGDGRISSTPFELGAAPRPTPEPVAASQAFVAIAAGHYSSCAISREGATYCWGGDAARELGMTLSGGCPVELYGWDYYSVGMVSDYPCSTVPVRVNLGRGLTSLSAGGDGQCGVTADAALVCWGFLFDAPFVVPGARVSRAWVTESSVCGLEMSGVVTCWSLDGTFSITLPFGGDVMLVNLDSNGAHTCGVSQATPGAVYCEGSNDKGQLGDGTTYHRGLAVGVISPREP
jgi:alpha-tubulin suppressor-like RCC1 family protein